MSHIVKAKGDTIKDPLAVAETVKDQCKQCTFAKQKNFKTWADDHGSLVGDYPLPGHYQVKMLGALKKDGVDVHALAKAKGVELPENLLDLLEEPWNLATQRKLLSDPVLNEGYKHVSKNVVGKDAEFVIKYKDGQGPKGAYEIGLVPHLVNKGEYIMMTDFYNQGNGLLNAPGIGKHKTGADGEENWGGELKRGYAKRAALRRIQQEVKAGNPEFAGKNVKVESLPNGKTKIIVEGGN